MYTFQLHLRRISRLSVFEKHKRNTKYTLRNRRAENVFLTIMNVTT